MPKVIKKTGATIYECLSGFRFNNIFLQAAIKFWLHDSFLRPIPETKK